MILNPKLNELNFNEALIALDLETTGLYPWLDKIELIAITDELGLSYVIEPKNYEKTDLQNFFQNLTACKRIINHNIKFDLGFILYHFRVLLRNVHCTQVSQQILENGRQRELDFDLVSVLSRSLNIIHSSGTNKKEMQKSFTKKEIQAALDLLPAFRLQQYEYAIEDTVHLIELYKKQVRLLYKDSLDIVYHLEMKVLPILVKMEVEGCRIDRELWKYQIETYWVKEQKEIESRLDEIAKNIIKGAPYKYHFNRNVVSATQFDLFSAPTNVVIEDDTLFNYASQPHILSLFEFVKENPPLSKDGTPSVDEGSLQVYLTEHGDTKLSVFLEVLLEYRQISKLLSTYGDNFLAKLDQNSYIHTQYTQTQTETGRLSSKSPNLQNIPKGSSKEPNKDIRKCFIPAPGCKFITCDMGAAEVRIAADYSGDELLLDSLAKGVDMHSKLASASYSIIFGRPVTISNTSEEIEIDGHKYILEELRGTHKSVVFAKFYKGGAARVYGVLSKYINTHHKDQKERMGIARRISDAIDKELPKLSIYLTGLITQAQSEGFLISSSFGRVRYFNKEKVYGEAANYPIQGSNAEAMKMALIKIDKLLNELGYGRIVMNIHDEVVVECPNEYADGLAPQIQKIVADSLGYFLKVVEGKASVAIGDFWKK